MASVATSYSAANRSLAVQFKQYSLREQPGYTGFNVGLQRNDVAAAELQTGRNATLAQAESNFQGNAEKMRTELYAAQNAAKATNSVNSATQAISTVSLDNSLAGMRVTMSEGMSTSSLSSLNTIKFDREKIDKGIASQIAFMQGLSSKQSTTAQTDTTSSTSGTNSSSEGTPSASSGAASNQIASLSQQAMTTASNEKTQTSQSSLQIQRTSKALNVYNEIGMGQSRAGINALSGSTTSQGGTSTVDSSQTAQGLQQMGMTGLSMANQAPQQMLGLLR